MSDPRRDDASPRFSRRAVLSAGVWSAPVIVLATAAPAAADVSATNPALRRRTVYPLPVNAASYQASTLSLNDIGFIYDYTQWGVGDADGPTTATVTYQVAILDRNGTPLAPPGDGGPIVIPKYQSNHEHGRVADVPPGTYILRLTVTAVVFSSATAAYDFQAELPQTSDSAPITVS